MNIFPLQNNFAFGCISEDFRERTDLAQRNGSVKTLLNMIPNPRGSIKTRPGIKYQQTISAIANLTFNFAYVWEAEFQSIAQTFIMMAYGHNTTASSGQMYVHRATDLAPFGVNVPASFAFSCRNDGSTVMYPKSYYNFVLHPNGLSLDVFYANGTLPATRFTYDGTVFVATHANITFTSAPWASPNLPSTCCFFEGRRWCFHNNYIWASVPGSPDDFTVGTGSASDSIVGITDIGSAPCAWVYPAHDLIYSTYVAQYKISSVGGVIYAGDIDIHEQSRIPSYKHQPELIHNDIVFLGPSANYTITYNDTDNKWVTNELDFFNKDFHMRNLIANNFGTIVHYDTNDGWVYEPNTNNRIISKDLATGIVGYASAEYSTVSGSTLSDIVSSNINKYGSSVHPNGLKVERKYVFFENNGDVIIGQIRSDYNVPLDLFILSSTLMSGSFITSLSHLEGESVYVWVEKSDGSQVSSGPYTVSSAQINIGSDRALYSDGAGSYLSVYVGLAFTQTIVTWPMDKGGQAGSARSYSKRFQEIVLKLIGNSSVPKVNDYWDEEIGNPLGKEVAPQSSLDYKYLSDDSDEDAVITITISTPANIHLGAICGKVTQDKV